MLKVLPLSVVALALLAGCGSRQPVVVVPPAPVVTTPPATATTPPAATVPVVASAPALRPGFGRIESMTPVQTAASAGGTAPTSMQRLGVRMEDGSMQVLDTAAPGFVIGDRVELTREGHIRRHPPS
jgi:hypothetical protein